MLAPLAIGRIADARESWDRQYHLARCICLRPLLMPSVLRHATRLQFFIFHVFLCTMQYDEFGIASFSTASFSATASASVVAHLLPLSMYRIETGR